MLKINRINLQATEITYFDTKLSEVKKKNSLQIQDEEHPFLSWALS